MCNVIAIHQWGHNGRAHGRKGSRNLPDAETRQLQGRLTPNQIMLLCEDKQGALLVVYTMGVLAHPQIRPWRLPAGVPTIALYQAHKVSRR